MHFKVDLAFLKEDLRRAQYGKVTHHDGVAVDSSLELREVWQHAAVARQGNVPHLDPEVVASLENSSR